MVSFNSHGDRGSGPARGDEGLDDWSFETQTTTNSKDVISFYDEYARTWDTRFGDTRSVRAFHETRLASFLEIADPQAHDRCIEVGVGTGVSVEDIAARVRELTCIDGSERMLEILQRKYRHLKNVESLCIDLAVPSQTLPAPADLVYCFAVFEHIIERDTFIANCRAMLLPRGRLVLVMANGSSPWYSLLRRFGRPARHCSSTRNFTRTSIDAYMQSAGFVPEAHDYWGYFPAGAGDTAYRILSTLGRFVDMTPLRRFAGGLTVSYRLAPEP